MEIGTRSPQFIAQGQEGARGQPVRRFGENHHSTGRERVMDPAEQREEPREIRSVFGKKIAGRQQINRGPSLDP